MSKSGKNYVKKQLKINTDNFGFSISHYKIKPSQILSITQKTEPHAQINTNNNINNQYNNNNINIINININSNPNSNTNANTTKNKKRYINSNSNSNITFNQKTKNPLINFIKKKIYNQNKKSEIKRTKETNPNNIDYNSIKKNKKYIKDKNISYSTSRTETETNIFKNSYKTNNYIKKQDILEPPPKQMIISYFDIKNILNSFQFQLTRPK